MRLVFRRKNKGSPFGEPLLNGTLDLSYCVAVTFDSKTSSSLPS